ncbi:hypothetical protein KCU67_g10816, partial [Aureobasidium melanogenum]
MNPACFDGSSGIFIDGGIDNKIEQNWITGMELADQHGAGIIIWDEPDAVASGNKIERNVLKDNDVDIWVNSTGTGNEFNDNHCSTSGPTGLCNARRLGKLA